MSEQGETSSADDGRRGVTVRRLVPAGTVTSRQIVHAVKAATGERRIGSINVALVDDTTIASLNERYLGKARPTDVLAFDLRDDRSSMSVDGEVVVSAETARRQARALKVPVDEELLRYIVHGVLHLAGYDDATPAQRRRMRRAEDRILASLASADNPRGTLAGNRAERRTAGRAKA